MTNRPAYILGKTPYKSFHNWRRGKKPLITKTLFSADDDASGAGASDAKRAKKEKKKKKKKKSKKRAEEEEADESQDSMFGDGDESYSEGEALEYLDEIEAKLERKKKRKSEWREDVISNPFTLKVQTSFISFRILSLMLGIFLWQKKFIVVW